MAQCQGPRAQIRLFWSSPAFGRKILQKSKVPGAQLNVNPARAKIRFVGVTIYGTFFNNNSPHLASFYATKYFWKKLATVRGMLIEQTFELRGPGSPGRICIPITGCFHDKAILSKENIRLDCYSLLKYCRWQCTLLSLLGPNHVQNLTPRCKILNMFWTEIVSKRWT